ncbi:hypothetical protein [Streptodolium elevatio]|uniref:ASCH domain-containing protein n=1 Tax=Streptodolium elevatio TaxID=3157996 RepID=A0ABV3DTE6_9ACTN
MSVTEGRPVRALTLHQPWAHAIAHLGKDVENRTRRTNFRDGLVLVHAGARVDHDALRDLPADVAAAMTSSAVVAVTRITDAHPDCGGRCSTWAQPGAWHWQLAGTVALTAPVPAPGAQGLWIPDDGLRRRVARALPAHAADRLGPLLASDLFPSPERTGRL